MPPGLPTERFLVFASREHTAWSEAEALAQALPRARLVNRSSSRLKDLLAVARFDVVEPLCVIALRNGRVLCRLTRLPDAATLLSTCAALGHTTVS